MSENLQVPLETDVAAVDAMLKAGDDFLLLDVREADEYAVAKIDGSVLLPMSELGNRVGELEEHRNRLIVVHCHHGGRSLQITRVLRSNGFENTQNMAGGIDAWSQQIDASVARY
jgi:rhodanese-related sulfurtransferase